MPLGPRRAGVAAPPTRAGRRPALRRRPRPYDRDLSDLVGELSTQSEEFRGHWASHNVRFHLNGIKRFHHPVVGDLNLNFERLDLAADNGLTIFTYTAEPGSRDEEALKLLGSWAATHAETGAAHTTGHAAPASRSQDVAERRAPGSP